MPPIKVYSDVPLHPEGVTPKTVQPDQNVQSQQPPTPTRTTNIPASDPSIPPPPQPGARPQPGPTPTASVSTDPPPPQPGAIPSVTAIHATTSIGYAPPPSQLNIPPPTSNQAPTHSTSTYQPQPSPFETGASLPITSQTSGTPLHARNPSLEHPPGYIQNPYAQDGSPSDRERFGAEARRASQEEGVMGQLKNVLGEAGKKLGEVEEAAWKWAKGK